MNRAAAEAAIRDLVVALGFDPDVPALETTARKTAEAFIDALTCGYDTELSEVLGRGVPVSGTVPVLATDVPLLFMCPHHLMPARGHGQLAFFAAGRAPGLSRIHRLFDACSRRLVLQEDLTQLVAETFMRQLSPRAVVVTVDAVHTCVAVEDFAHRDARFATRATLGDPDLVARLEAMLPAR